MMHVVFLLMMFSTGTGRHSPKVCSYQDIVNYLNLTTDASAFTVTRPVLDYKTPTVIELEIILYSILGVIEKTQTFIPLIWSKMVWNDERISWEPAQFCGITEISIPRQMLWKPDLYIYEMIQRDDSLQNPYFYMSYNGKIIIDEDLKLVSTCKMDVHKFPFDTQRCNITIRSAIHTVNEIRILPFSNSSRVTQFSREVMLSQGDWEFLQLSISSSNFTRGGHTWERLIFTFYIKRRPLIHIINFLMPILFFLVLDLASFFIADDRGEKLGFKVTLLLAISVLLLILNDILPSMSDKTPMIAIYCTMIFSMMLLSLLETILVTYLKETVSSHEEKLRPRDNCKDEQEKVEFGNCEADKKRPTSCSYIYKASNGDSQHELQLQVEEVNSSVQSGDPHVLRMILEELMKMRMTLNLHIGGREEAGKMHQLAIKINRNFFMFYLICVLVLLPIIFIHWCS